MYRDFWITLYIQNTIQPIFHHVDNINANFRKTSHGYTALLGSKSLNCPGQNKREYTQRITMHEKGVVDYNTMSYLSDVHLLIDSKGLLHIVFVSSLEKILDHVQLHNQLKNSKKLISNP